MNMPLERLQKVLAAAGLGSRRSCEGLIEQGRISVDGEVVTVLGTKVDAEKQEIRCDGERVRPAKPVYFLINKPRGYVSTASDEQGRPRVIDLTPHRAERVFTVGRLDVETEGILIVTNDGDFAQRVAHPRYGVGKTYRARVHGAMPNHAKQALLDGVRVGPYQFKADWVKIVKRGRNDSTVEITLHEGRNREVRRMFSVIGFPVAHLLRTRIGPLEDPALRVGGCRKLRPEEVKLLLDASSEAPKSKRKKRRTPK
jgi:23S rRNA pseudouridine2605 synthase